MIRKILTSKELSFEINSDTGELEIWSSAESFIIPYEDAAEMIIELRKQQLEYLQGKQGQEENLITKLLKSIWR